MKKKASSNVYTIENLPIDSLKLWGDNPRKIKDSEMKKLCSRLTEDPNFLKSRPILVNSCDGEYIVYAGNQRVRAAKLLGWKEIPCIVEKDLDEEVIKKRSILDNKTFGDWDWDMLANEWDSGLLMECGFKAEELGIGFEKKEFQKKFKIVLEFDDQDSLNEALPQINKLSSLQCKVKVKN